MMRFLTLFLVFFVSAAAADIPQSILSKAEKGDAGAQLDLATRYMSGEGAEQDDKKALEWLTKSAEGGNREAVFSLGMLYLKGHIVEKDAAQAAAWMEKASGLGDAYAQFTLAEMCATGEGVPQDMGKAVKYWKLAAEGGHAQAQLKIGTAYLDGQMTETDYAEAYFWFSFPSEGDVYPGEAQALRDKAASHLEPAKIEELKKSVQEWVARDFTDTKKKADGGDMAALTQLALLHQQGSGAIKNVKTAEALLAKAAEGGDTEAQFQLGEILSGYGRWKYDEALPLFRKAAEKDHAGAEERLGDLYADGAGVKRDEKEAATWYRQAANHGRAHAQTALGVLYYEGRGVARDLVEALFWLSLAAAHGDDSKASLRELAAEDMTPEQKEAVKKRLQEWRDKADTP